MGYTRAQAEQAYLTGERESEVLTPREALVDAFQDAGDAARIPLYVVAALARTARLAIQQVASEAITHRETSELE